MKISVCITVLNEEKTIGDLLDSLLSQSKKPDEIVIVDAGSSDATVSIITKYQSSIIKQTPGIKFKLIISKRATIAKGRNIAIKNATGDVIATTDAGCIPHRDWLEKITKPFLIHLGGDLRPPSEEYADVSRGVHFRSVLEQVGVVAGFYDMHAGFPMQKAISAYLGIHPKRYDLGTFLPSTRSMAFKKQIWERVGGFNEKLDNTGEDTQFIYNIVKTGTKIIREGEARVDWKEIENISFKEAMRKFFNYAKGDVQSKIWRHPVKTITSHNIKVILIFIRYLIGLILLVFSVFNPAPLVLLAILAILYILWPIWKWRDVIFDWKARLWLPVIQISSDFAVMSGFIYGLL